MVQDTEKAEIGLNESPFYQASSAEILLASEEAKLGKYP